MCQNWSQVKLGLGLVYILKYWKIMSMKYTSKICKTRSIGHLVYIKKIFGNRRGAQCPYLPRGPTNLPLS